MDKFYPPYRWDGEINYGIYGLFFPVLTELEEDNWLKVGTVTGESPDGVSMEGEHRYSLYQRMTSRENNLAALRAGLPGDFNSMGFSYMVITQGGPFVINMPAPVTEGSKLFFPQDGVNLIVHIDGWNSSPRW